MPGRAGKAGVRPHETDGVFSDAGELDSGFRAPYVRLTTGRTLLLQSRVRVSDVSESACSLPLEQSNSPVGHSEQHRPRLPRRRATLCARAEGALSRARAGELAREKNKSARTRRVAWPDRRAENPSSCGNCDTTSAMYRCHALTLAPCPCGLAPHSSETPRDRRCCCRLSPARGTFPPSLRPPCRAAPELEC
jgi:hypothetical protein